MTCIMGCFDWFIGRSCSFNPEEAWFENNSQVTLSYSFSKEKRYSIIKGLIIACYMFCDSKKDGAGLNYEVMVIPDKGQGLDGKIITTPISNIEMISY